jgi:ELWxxDGT repeat protein
LQDIVTQPVPADILPGLPEGFVQVNDRLVFSTPSGDLTDDPGFLWSTDGTPEGTRVISSTICPSPCQSITPVAAWPGAALLMTTQTTLTGSALKMRLWRTDGTPAGTFPLTETTRIAGAFVAGPSPGAGLFYFFDCPEFEGCQLWRSDGTRPGTHAATDLKFSFVTPMPAAGRFYFMAVSVEGTGLWVTDGTADGTRFLAATSFDFGSGAMAETPFRLFFTAGSGTELWVSDGTPDGTRLVHRSALSDLIDHDCAALQPFLEPAGEGVYFLAGDSVHRAQIWRSDGTESGTRRLTDVQDCNMAQAVPLGRAGGRWVFTLPYYGGPLWTAGADFSHPALLTDCPEGCPTFVTAYQFANASPPGRLLFIGGDAQHGWELWATDGTGRGTRRLTDACPGACSSFDFDFLLASRRLDKTYFRMLGPSGRYELWVTDGTLGSTRRVATGFPSDFGILKDLVFFGITNSRQTTSELWVTDGTPAGQRRVATLRTLAGSYPQFAPQENGALIFADEDRDGLRTLWRSDGTPERTVPLPGFEGSYTEDLTRAGELTFFVGAGPQSPYEKVWRTDGTPRGTFPVARLPRNSFVDLNIAWNGKYLFAVSGAGSDGCAYWLSDGTPLGTREIVPELAGSRCPTGLHALGSRFLFIERVPGDAGLTPQVFVSDGTAAGTRQISNIPGPREFIDTDLAEINGVIFFRLYQQNGQEVEVWRTDGSSEGTYRLPLGLSRPDALFAFQGSLYLTAAVDAESPLGFWRVPLDGGSPVLLTAASPTFDPAAVFKNAFTPAGGRLFFAARDETNGAELWVSDGTAEGTRMVWDLNLGLLSSSPTNLTVIGGYLYFGADDGESGVEPWALRLEP